MIVIRCVDMTGIARHPSAGSPAGQFLMSYDPDAHQGRGYACWTDDIGVAMKFKTSGDAWLFWRKPSKVRPIRPDGRPNRPLTAFSVEVIDEEQL
jgi:hypothetical protein